jgi:hypothetical protein
MSLRELFEELALLEPLFQPAYERGYEQGLTNGLRMTIELGVKLRFGNEEYIQDLLQKIPLISDIVVLQQIVRLLETTTSLDELRAYVSSAPGWQTLSA